MCVSSLLSETIFVLWLLACFDCGARIIESKHWCDEKLARKENEWVCARMLIVLFMISFDGGFVEWMYAQFNNLHLGDWKKCALTINVFLI